MNCQTLKSYNDSTIIINYSKAFRIQNQLLTIPFYKTIIIYKDSIIIKQKSIIAFSEQNTELLTTKNKELTNSIKEKRFKIIKKNIAITLLGAFIIVQNYYLVFKF